MVSARKIDHMIANPPDLVALVSGRWPAAFGIMIADVVEQQITEHVRHLTLDVANLASTRRWLWTVAVVGQDMMPALARRHISGLPNDAAEASTLPFTWCQATAMILDATGGQQPLDLPSGQLIVSPDLVAHYRQRHRELAANGQNGPVAHILAAAQRLRGKLNRPAKGTAVAGAGWTVLAATVAIVQSGLVDMIAQPRPTRPSDSHRWAPTPPPSPTADDMARPVAIRFGLSVLEAVALSLVDEEFNSQDHP